MVHCKKKETKIILQKLFYGHVCKIKIKKITENQNKHIYKQKHNHPAVTIENIVTMFECGVGNRTFQLLQLN